MKHLFLRRFLPALLCLVFALSLTACGGETERPETEGGSGMTGALSGGKGNVSEPKDDPDDPEKAEAGLVLLRACIAVFVLNSDADKQNCDYATNFL